jgi:hypothetical protein
MFTLIKQKRLALLQKLLALKRHIIIKRSPKTYLKQQGWRQTSLSLGSEWQGYYRSPYGSFKGRVGGSASYPRFYLYKPPEKLRKHPHWACFSSQGNDWYSVHFKRVPKDLDSGVMAVERIISEAMRLK